MCFLQKVEEEDHVVYAPVTMRRWSNFYNYQILLCDHLNFGIKSIVEFWLESPHATHKTFIHLRKTNVRFWVNYIPLKSQNYVCSSPSAKHRCKILIKNSQSEPCFIFYRHVFICWVEFVHENVSTAGRLWLMFVYEVSLVCQRTACGCKHYFFFIPAHDSHSLTSTLQKKQKIKPLFVFILYNIFCLCFTTSEDKKSTNKINSFRN